jgi:hypothetical protein
MTHHALPRGRLRRITHATARTLGSHQRGRIHSGKPHSHQQKQRPQAVKENNTFFAAIPTGAPSLIIEVQHSVAFVVHRRAVEEYHYNPSLLLAALSRPRLGGFSTGDGWMRFDSKWVWIWKPNTGHLPHVDGTRSVARNYRFMISRTSFVCERR